MPDVSNLSQPQIDTAAIESRPSPGSDRHDVCVPARQVRLAAAAPAMLLSSLTYVFIGAHHWRKGASLWAVVLDTALSAALAVPMHLTALAIYEVCATRLS